MKSNRQSRILELIETKDIETQEQLLAELESSGFSTTQATISRDIKELRIIKELGPGGSYRYRSAPKLPEPTVTAKLNSIFRQCVTKYDHAQNIVVLKTMPGLAGAACSALDAMDWDSLVGTIAGDDTAFILMRDNAAAAAMCAEIKKQLS
jgi:transcriptional regulator of arginine metabolism